MKTRIITAVIGIPILLFVSVVGSWPLAAVILILTALGAYEMNRLFQDMGMAVVPTVLNLATALILAGMLLLMHWAVWPFFVALLLLAAAYMTVERTSLGGEEAKRSYQVVGQWLGSAYVGVGLGALGALRLCYPNWTLILLAFLNVWITDSVAYFVGSRYGKHPLAPRISPKKSWEGALAGTLAALIICGVYIHLFVHTSITVEAETFFARAISLPLAFLLAAVISVAAQVGDLLESFLKRRAGVKDSGKILPGHGGILDRFDSLLLSSILLLLLVFSRLA